jgi:hypothetical protein
MSGWSPSQSASSRSTDEDAAADLEEWVDVLRRALEENGELGRKALANIAGARYWGPGAYSRALRAGVADGSFRKSGRNRFAPAE